MMDRRPNHRITDARKHAAATAHSDAAPQPKDYAYKFGVTPRTARRHRSPHEAKGSPLYRHYEYLHAVKDPWPVVAGSWQIAEEATFKNWSNRAIVTRIRRLHVEDALGEGEDNATRARRHVPMLERAAIVRRDAAHDIELASLYYECYVRGITEEEVFGG